MARNQSRNAATGVINTAIYFLDASGANTALLLPSFPWLALSLLMTYCLWQERRLLAPVRPILQHLGKAPADLESGLSELYRCRCSPQKKLLWRKPLETYFTTFRMGSSGNIVFPPGGDKTRLKSMPSKLRSILMLRDAAQTFLFV